jgi:hypothetical protein
MNIVIIGGGFGINLNEKTHKDNLFCQWYGYLRD